MGKLACVFPGQGSQSVGMGLDLFNNYPVAKEVFADVDRIAAQNFSKLCFEGPEADLKKTINTQPTILAASLAAWACYKALGGPKPDFVAGHSLGEITALVAAESMQIEEAVVLVQERAVLMEECPAGAMSAVLGVASEALEECCRKASEELKNDGADELEAVVIVANFNTRDQLVISGNPKAVVRAGELAKAAGGKVIPLPVGGAFHSPLMTKAAGQFVVTLDQMAIEDPVCPVVQNFDGKPSTTGSEIRGKLTKQMDNAVRWCASVEYMIAQGVDTFVEIGPGKVLVGTVKKIDKGMKLFNVSDAATLQATIEGLKETVLSR
ncbi:MAG TPA: ACP S-malonyltransferase [Oculatellaceae cyanobacterium]